MAIETNQNRSYTQEDIQQILQIAIAYQVKDGDREFSYQQLAEIAGELEIAPELLQQAESNWLIKQKADQQRQEFDSFRNYQFKKRFAKFASINTVLILLDLISGGGLSWSLYLLVIWGLGISLNAWNTFQLKGEDYEFAFQKWHGQRQLKQSFGKIFNRVLESVAR
jgi:DNA-binding transcriptional MerR regulator